MKTIVTIARILVGGLFIFSGLVKAIDPLGLTYKMQEFFEVWAAQGYMSSLMDWLNSNAFIFSVVMITLEVTLGIALLVGWSKKITLWLLFTLIMVFTFLTAYVLFSGKIRACGCFGDCIPLTPIQTFTKDIILLVLALILLFNQKYIAPIFSGSIPFIIVLLGTIATVFLQSHVIKHLPIKDCLPYKKGNNILELRKMPADAVPDKFEYTFTYQKDGVKKDFATSALPDSTWTYVDRKQVLVEKGKNNVPLINDFSLASFGGGDSTETILSKADYYMLFIKNVEESHTERWNNDFANVLKKTQQQNKVIYIVTSDSKNADVFFNKTNKYNLPIYVTDVTAIKTAARANPTIFVMKGSVVQEKYSWADFNKLAK